jgi:hypothetical protein
MTSEPWTPADSPAPFPGLGLCFYERGPIRPPRPGDYYATPGRPIRQATEPHQWGSRIVRPTHRAELDPRPRWRKGAPIL